MSFIEPHEEKARIAVIGGTGVYDPSIFRDSKDLKISTPYGPPSSFLSLGSYEGEKVAFIPRHGRNHSIPPHLINYRANIYALKLLGVERIISVSSVGSLQENLKPGDFAIPDQFIDRTRKRADTFFDGSLVAHISSANPFCPEIRERLYASANSLQIPIHSQSTYVCIEGPRFSTRAESKLFREWGADLVGMTLYPECVLAREAEICYASIAMVTDYDVWAEKPVSADEVATVMRKNVNAAKKLVLDTIRTVPAKRSCSCGKALTGAIL